MAARLAPSSKTAGASAMKSSVVNLLDVEMIVVGGGLGEADDLLLDTARATMWTHVLGAQRRPEVPVVPARLGNDAGVIGAALLAASRG